MLSDENAFLSYTNIYISHLCAMVLHCVMHAVFFVTVATAQHMHANRWTAHGLSSYFQYA